MNCQENDTLIHGYVDGELDLLNTLQFEAHLRECATCAQAVKNHQVLRSALRAGNVSFKPPADLAQRIHLTLHQASEPGKVGRQASTPVRGRLGAAPRRMPWRISWAVAAVAASAAVIAVMTWRLGPVAPSRSQDDLLAQEVLASHVRSLMANHLTDVPSSDQHTVKPWFDGKLDFSPPVRDLNQQGFPLVGGRLDYLQGRPVAALVYERRKHFINLFIWPAPKNAAQQMVTRQGYHLLHWAQSGMTYWAASDVNPAELQEFVRLVQGESGPPPK